jgi:asparagine N-glycosylation enzyme membrane subunit Stt3
VPTGLSDFKKLLKEYRGLAASTFGSAAAVPFAASLVDLSPPWPKGVVLVTAVVELLALALVFQFLRTSRKSLINGILLSGTLVLVLVSTVYLMQLSLYTFAVPTTGERFVKGTECTANARKVFGERCPDLGLDELRETEYSVERLWTPRSVTATRMRLVLLWAAAFGALSTTLGSFLVYQLRAKRSSPRRGSKAARSPDAA